MTAPTMPVAYSAVAIPLSFVAAMSGLLSEAGAATSATAPAITQNGKMLGIFSITSRTSSPNHSDWPTFTRTPPMVQAPTVPTAYSAVDIPSSFFLSFNFLIGFSIRRTLSYLLCVLGRAEFAQESDSLWTERQLRPLGDITTRCPETR